MSCIIYIAKKIGRRKENNCEGILTKRKIKPPYLFIIDTFLDGFCFEKELRPDNRNRNNKNTIAYGLDLL